VSPLDARDGPGRGDRKAHEATGIYWVHRRRRRLAVGGARTDCDAGDWFVGLTMAENNADLLYWSKVANLTRIKSAPLNSAYGHENHHLTVSKYHPNVGGRCSSSSESGGCSNSSSACVISRCVRAVLSTGICI